MSGWSRRADVAVNYNAGAAGAKEVVAEIEQLGRRAEAQRPLGHGLRAATA